MAIAEPNRDDQIATTGRPLDMVIAGAGVIGLAIAWRAARRGMRVRVLEREHPGAGSSGVAAGMLAPAGEANWGEDGLLRMALASHALWPRFDTELAADSGSAPNLRAMGALHVALDRDEAAELARRAELIESAGLEARHLGPRECRRAEPGLSPSVIAGLQVPDESAVDPPTLVDALLRACRAQGAEVICGAEAEVTGALLDGGRVGGLVDRTGRMHRAERTVVACGAWSGTLGEMFGVPPPPVRPVKGQILTLRGDPGTPVCSGLVVTERVYIVPRPDGRLVVGATVEELGFDQTVTAGGVHELLREAYRTLPDIAELEFERAAAGLRPGSPDNAPLIGHGAADGLLLATGHHRNGILLAPITAEAICDLATGAGLPPEVEAADPSRFDPAPLVTGA